VAVIREFLKPVEITSTVRSNKNKITKTRLLTSEEFAVEMAEKEREKNEILEQKEKEKEEKRAKKERGKNEKPAQKILKKNKKQNETQKKQNQRKVVKKNTKKGREDQENSVSLPQEDCGDEKENRNEKKNGTHAKKRKTTTKNKEKPKRKNTREKSEESEKSAVDDPEEIDLEEVPDTSSERAETDNEEDNELCGTCNKSFQKDFRGEQWIRCVRCSLWYHQSCQGLTDYIPDFVCESCPLAALV